MAFRFDHAEPVQDGVRRVAAERLDDAIGRLERLVAGSDEDVTESVHEVRKRCKEVRGLIRLVRPALGDEYRTANKRLRAAAEELSSTRDAQVLVATITQLGAAEREAGRDADLADLTGSHEREATAAEGSLASGAAALQDALARLEKVRRRVDHWKVGDGFDAIAKGLSQTYRGGRRGLRRASASPTDEDFHAWRKPVKYLWYQLRLLEPTAPSVLTPLVARFDDLADALGSDHDLAVLVERLEADADRHDREQARLAARLARARQKDLRETALGLGARLYAEPRGAFTARMEAYWEIDRTLGPEHPHPAGD